MSKVIGNPPYNANQLKENENNKNSDDIFHYVYAVLHNPAYRKK